MIRVVSTGDWHVTDGERLSDQRATLDKLVTAASAERPDAWLVGGDLYGTTVPHRSTPAERRVLFPALVRMASVAPVIIVAGNHDHPADLMGLAHLAGDYPIHVVSDLSEPSEFVVSVPTRTGAALSVYCLPYPSKKHLLRNEAIRGVVEAQERAQAALGSLLHVWAARIRQARAADPTGAHVGLMHVQIGGVETSGGEVLAGQEIELSRSQVGAVGFDFVSLHHIHRRQEAAHRAVYPGAPWRNDFAETDERGYAIVDIGTGAGQAMDPDDTAYDDPGRHRVSVGFRATDCRAFVTLRYRWAATTEDGAPTWTVRPGAAELASVAGAEVRMILTVPEAHTASCPWEDEVARVAELAHRVKVERKTEPTLRVRAPGVAAATTDHDRAREFWRTVANPPTIPEQEEALECLADLSRDDDVIAAEIRALGAA